MLSWSQFQAAAAELADFGQARLHNRVGYLATIRTDGGPRVHPVTPIIGDGHLFVYMEPTSPKGHDLRRDARFALHASVEDTGGGQGEFLVHGQASLITDAQVRAHYDTFASYKPKARYILFELLIGQVAATTYPPGGEPVRQRWQASG